MTRLGFVLAALLVLASSSAQAQTHPCDTPAPTAQTITQNVPHKVRFCSPVTDKVEAAVTFVDTVASSLQPVTAVGAASPVSGLVLYETTPFLSVTNRGQHTLQVAAYNRNAAGVSQEGAKSSPFVFAVASEFPLSLSLTADKASPQVKGTQIQLTATAQGGLAPYAYRWTINGGLWIPWGTENTKLWDSSLAPAGTYVIEVWARSSDSTADAPEALATLTYVIGEPVVPAPGAPVIRELAR